MFAVRKAFARNTLEKTWNSQLAGMYSAREAFLCPFCQVFPSCYHRGPSSSKGFVCKLQTILPCACAVAGVKIQPVS